jgi:hypothetical protein
MLSSVGIAFISGNNRFDVYRRWIDDAVSPLISDFVRFRRSVNIPTFTSSTLT